MSALAHYLSLFDAASLQRCTEIATPSYVYDLTVARSKLARLRQAFPSVDVHYAVKSNPHPAVISEFARLDSGFDVASLGELELLLGMGIDSRRIGFAGPGKSDRELEHAVEAGVVINVESPRELERIAALCQKSDRRADVALRVNPPFALKRSGMQMNGGPSQFGIDAEQVPALLDTIDSPLRLVGYHVFAGSQNLHAERICEFLDAAFDLLEELCARSGTVESINLGAGLGIPYHEADREVDVETVGKVFEQGTARFPATRFVLESGRYLVGECGVYVTRVRDLKQSRGKTFAIVEGGLNHHLAATGNFGMVIKKDYPIAVLSKLDRDAKERYTIAGPLCTPLDVLGTDVPLPELEVGDVIGVFASGAYGYTASPHAFLGHGPPGEVVFG